MTDQRDSETGRQSGGQADRQPHGRADRPSLRTGDGDGSLHVQAGRSVKIGRKNQFATGNITNIKQNIRSHPWASGVVAAVVLGLTVYGGVAAVSSGSGIDLSVVNEAGAGGAVKTAEQIRASERLGDGAAWCALVAPSDSGCPAAMNGSFAGRGQDYRAKVDQIGIGSAEINETGAEVPLTWDGQKEGTIPLAWSGGRWQMSMSSYGLVKLGGGVFLSLVDAKSGNLKLGGIPIPS